MRSKEVKQQSDSLGLIWSNQKNMKFDFKNKVAVVTGGSSGIGEAIARKFTESGAKVIVADTHNCDVRKEADVKSFFERVIAEHGQIDVLVNSAGIYSFDQADIAQVSSEQFDDTMDINFRGIFLTTKYAIPHLLKTKGNIVNISSALGLVPEKESPIYCASKAAVIMFTKATALQYAKQGVRINAVCPGPIDTPMLRRGFPNEKDMADYLAKNPISRVGTPEEVASLVLFIASDENSFMTGGAYPVDGGESL
jgi:NAD(P)-dependent dehydrogenase (short-subunit alcohol dehydrogenase family)